MKWLKIKENKNTSFRSGSVLMIPQTCSSGNDEVMIICNDPEDPNYFATMAITGENAGVNCHTKIPHHIYDEGELLAGKILDHWQRWTESKCDSSEMSFISNVFSTGLDAADIEKATRRWLKLSENKKVHLSKGALIRFAATYPFESEVVMMVCESPLGESRLGLITISGYKAGFNCYTNFPAGITDENGAIIAGLVYDNWDHWIWPEWSPDCAWISPEGLSADDLKSESPSKTS